MIKKLLSILLAAAMAFSVLCVSAAAADPESYKITISDTKGTAADSFEAYQVFAGTLSEDETVLSNITWGSGVTVTDTLTIGNKAYTAEEAAAALTDGTLTTDDFSAAIADKLSNVNYKAVAENSTASAVIEVPAAGYYFVKNTNDSAGDNEAYTKYILQVVADVTVAAKTDAPSVEKKVKNNDEPVSEYRDANNVAIGDTVNYEITSHVPDMTHYSQYYFIVNDELSKGLTFDEASLKITVNGTALDAGDDYVLTTGKNADTNGTKLEIVFKNFIQYKNQTGAEIVVTYDAVLNDQAEVNENGNPNSVTLTYSNNPNKTGKGEDKPGPDDEDVTGTTPKDWTITYTTKLAIYKTDAKTGEVLKDAEFTMSGVKTNSTTTYTETYVEDTVYGTWYKLTDGTYTETIPTAATADQYDSTTTKYLKKVVSTVNEVSENVTRTVTTNENGIADLGSLAVGTYTITEIKAPDGYNLLTAPITIVITADTDSKTVTEGDETAAWTVKQNGSEISINEAIDATSYLVGITNSKGASLPSTGGIGTTLFYVIGGFLVLAAGAVLITRKRMGNRA